MGSEVSPRFVGHKVGLHPVWLIFALFVSATCSASSARWWRYLAAAVGVLVRFACRSSRQLRSAGTNAQATPSGKEQA
jgi:hypothetical protein